MASSTSLYRKYRSHNFDELVGQEPVVRTLKNAIATGRIAHAYLFTGPRGVGKTSAARLLARAANCTAEGEDKPCNKCPNCLAVSRDLVTDLIEIDAASNTGVDNIRDVIERANFAPSVWHTKFYVVDECFRYEDWITLADGSKMPIGKLVESQWQGEVLSYNETTQRVEPKPIVRHMKKVPSLPMLKITFDNRRAVVCTFNHKFYTPQGKKHASDLEVGQFVYANYERITKHQLDTVAGAALGDGHLSMTGSGMRARLSISQGVVQREYLEYKKSLLGNLVRTEPRYQFSPIMKDWLQEKWGITGGVSATARGPVVWLTLAGTARLHEVIAPYVPPSMAYKLLPQYQNRFQLQSDNDRPAGLAVSTVKKIEWVPSTDYVYNIEVADNHNYFVRDILVANCHMLTVSAFNALLKTLEEPPPHTSFILATTEIHKVPATVASRCQRFDFRRIPLSAMLGWLEHVCAEEGIQAERAALELVSRHSTGSLRDALSLLDQLQVYSEGGITLQSVQEMLGASGSEEVATFVDCLVAGDLAGGLQLINRVLEEGLDLRQFNRQIVEHLRSLMLVKSGAASQSESVLLDVTEEMKSRMQAQAAKVDIPGLLRWLNAFAEADANLRSTSYRQLPLEMALVTATLRPEETQSRQPARDHSAELNAGIEQIGVVAPRPRSNTSANNEPARPTRNEMPPPIHSELGHVGNGRAHQPPTTGPTPQPPQRPVPEQEDKASLMPALDNGASPDQRGPAQDESGTESGAQAQPVSSQSDSRDPAAELERLKALWPKLVDHIKARSRQAAAVFDNPNLTQPYSVVRNVCTIRFRDPIHVTRSKQEKQRELIEDALSWVLGYACRVESITFAEAEAGGGEGQERLPAEGNGPNTTREKPSPYDTPRGKAAMNIFGINKFDDTNKES